VFCQALGGVWLKLDHFSHEQTDFSLTQKLTEHSRIAENGVVGNITAWRKFYFREKFQNFFDCKHVIYEV